MTQPLTIQEMFNRAVIGLASQGFTRCLRTPEGPGCMYSDDKGKHCAWGWVDTDIPSNKEGTVYTLQAQKLGVAAQLNDDTVRFAIALQNAHDRHDTPAKMKLALASVASSYNLSIPPEMDAPHKDAA